MDKKETAGKPGVTGVRKGPNVVGLAILAVVAVVGGVWGSLRLYDSVTYVSTDDAAVDGTQIKLGSKTLGRIAAIKVSDGDLVNAGDPLVLLDDTDYRAQEKQALAALETARKSLDLAKVSLDRSRDDLERARSLYANGAATAEARDHAQGTWDTANAQYALSQAQVDAANAQLGVIEAQLLNTRILSPISGTVDHIALSVGDVVQPSQTILTVNNLSDLWVTANLEETKIAKILPGAPVKINVDAWDGVPFTGTVEMIRAGIVAPAFQIGEFTKTTQRIPVRIRFDPETFSGENAPRLVPGMSVEIKVRVSGSAK